MNENNTTKGEKTDKVTVLSLEVDADNGFSIFLIDFERPMLQVTLHVLVIHFAANETLGVKHSVLWVRVKGIFSAVADTRTASVKATIKA